MSFHQNALLASDRIFVIGLKRPRSDGQGRHATSSIADATGYLASSPAGAITTCVKSLRARVGTP
jgi:hypothetical protein